MDDRIELAHYLRILRKQWLIVVFTVVAVTGLAIVNNIRVPQRFSAVTTILLHSNDAGVAVEDSFRNVPLLERELQGEITFARSDDVISAVHEQLGTTKRALALEVFAGEDVDIIRFRATAIDRALAVEAANTWADAYLAAKASTAISEVEGLIARFNARLDELATEREELRSVLDQLEDERAEATLPRRQQQLDRDIDREARRISFRLDAIDAEVIAIAEGMTELQIREQLATEGTSQLVAVASDSKLASRPFWLDVIFGLFASVLLGVGLAFAREALDDRIRTSSDVLEITEVPVIGAIPEPSAHLRGVNYDQVVRQFPGSSMAQAILGIRNAVQFAIENERLGSILITSPVAGEGKSTTVANLGFALADIDRLVLVADVDLHRSRLHRSFGVPASPGLTDHLNGGERLDDLVIDMSSRDSQFFFAPSGSKASRPSEVVASPPFLDVLKSIEKGVDLLLLDGPPVLPVADAQALAYFADATILCVRVGKSKRSELEQAIVRLRQSGGEVMAIVLVGSAAADRYDYYSSTEHTVEERGIRARARRRLTPSRT